MRRFLVALALVLALVATGCATTGPNTGTQGAGEKSGTNAPTATPPSQQAPTEETPEANAPLAFGTSMEWKDGLYVNVSKPVKFEPSEYAVGGDAPFNVAFTVKIVNNTGKPFDASMFMTTLQSGNQEAEQVYDEGYGEAPSTKLLDGREAIFKIGYNVTDPNDLVMEVTPDFEHESVLYATS